MIKQDQDMVIYYQCNSCGHKMQKKRKICPVCKNHVIKERLERRVITK
jgi:rubrerythrin